jgi:hypothetical protein
MASGQIGLGLPRGQSQRFGQSRGRWPGGLKQKQVFVVQAQKVSLAAVKDLVPSAQTDDALAQLLDERQVVRAQQQSRALFGRVAHQCLQAINAEQVQAQRGFVQKCQRRAVHQRAQQRGAQLVPRGQLAQRCMHVGDVQQCGQRIEVRAVERGLSEATEVAGVLQRRQPFVAGSAAFQQRAEFPEVRGVPP